MSKEREQNSKRPFLYWGIGITALVFSYWGIMYCVYKSNDSALWLRPNEFGDMFGFLSSFFSGLAFAGLIITIRQQSHDLELQRKELNRANEETANQTKQFKEQTELAQQAQFRDEFYRRLALIRQVENSISVTYGIYNGKADPPRIQKTDFGIEAMTYFYNENIELIKVIFSCKQDVLIKSIKELKTYSETLLVWIKLLTELFNEVTENNKTTGYRDIIISLLSPHGKALILLFSPILYGDAYCKISEYIPKNDLPDNFPQDSKEKTYYQKVMLQKIKHPEDLEKWMKDNPFPLSLWLQILS